MLSEADDPQFEVGLQSQASLLHNSSSENQAHLGTTEQAKKLTFPPTCSSMQTAWELGTSYSLDTRRSQGGVWEESGRDLGGVRERTGRNLERTGRSQGEVWEESGSCMEGVRERTERRGLGEGAAAAAKSLQSCPTLCDPTDSSPPGSPVPGILQARTLEWVAISFSNACKWKVKVKMLSRIWPSVIPWTAAFQAPPSMGFSRQEYWSGVPLPWALD